MKTLYSLLLLLLLVNNLHAQTCGGEIVKFQETFGAGSGRATLPSGRTNYAYKASGALADGDYTLFNSTQAKPEWHSSPDHTGDADGRMMVTNASYAPGEFYRDTVYGVSSVSTYNIYFYAMNVNTVGTCSPNPILPRLQLVVESYNFDGSFTEIYRLTSDSLPQRATPTWVRISGQFYLPTACTAVRYRIINSSTGGCGNDLAIDDITFSQCNPSLLPVTGLTLKAAGDNNLTKLSWYTLSEFNTEKFAVERSADNITWTSIGTVRASGTSESRKEYSFTDHSPAVNNLYRIVSVDKNGKASYSNIVNIKQNAGEDAVFTVYPNPFTDHINLTLHVGQPQTVNIRVFDLKGKIVKTLPWTLKAGENLHGVHGLANLVAGMYLVNITGTDGTVIAKTKLLKK